MALQPYPFSYPPIRYSPIQQAFRSAIEAGAVAAFQLPFEKWKAQFEAKYAGQRAQAEAYGTEVGTQKADIDTGRVVTLSPETESKAYTAGMAPTYTNVSGKNYWDPKAVNEALQPISPVQKTFIQDISGRLGIPAADTQGLQYNWQAHQLSELYPGMGEAARIGETRREFDVNRQDDVVRQLTTPGPELAAAFTTVAARDPQSGQLRRLTFDEALALSKEGQYESYLQLPYVRNNPTLYRFVQQQAQKVADLRKAGVVFNFDKNVGIAPQQFAEEVQGLISAPASSSLASHTGILAQAAASYGLLMDARGKPVPWRGGPDAASAIDSFKGNRNLVEAMLYSELYPNPQALQQAQALGQSVPANTYVRGYLQEMWRQNAARKGDTNPTSWQLDNSALPVGFAPAAAPTATAVPYTPNPANSLIGQNGQLRPGVAANTPGAVGGNSTPGGAPEIAAPPVEFSGTDNQRLVYNWMYSRLKTNPSAWSTDSSAMAGLFGGSYEDFLNRYRQLGNDQGLQATSEERTALMNRISELEKVPAAARDTLLIRMRYDAMWAMAAARDAALGEFMSGAPAAEAGGKPAEKKAEPKKQ